jgi:hypothetical protein
MNKEQTAIEYCEETYPQTCEEFKNILDEMYITFCKKQRNYGPGNISVGTPLETKEDIKLSLTGIWLRCNDKINRLKNLIKRDGKNYVEGEALIDSFIDIANYGIIAMLVMKGKWKK